MGRDAVDCTVTYGGEFGDHAGRGPVAANEALSASDRQAATSFSNALREMPTVVDHFKSTLESTWLSLTPKQRTEANRAAIHLVNFGIVLEVEKVRTERLLGNADLAKVYAKDVQRFVAAAAALHGLVRTFLARERHARELATESPEEIAAAKEAMSDEIKIFPARPTPPKSLSNVSAKDSSSSRT